MEQPLGGNLARFVAEYTMKKEKIVSDESDSTTTSPKNDRSESSSPIPSRVPNTSSSTKPYVSGLSDLSNMGAIHSSLKARETSTPMVPPSSWMGGWSNRAPSASLSFQYGLGTSQQTSGESSSSPGIESQNPTPDDADADIEDANEPDNDDEIEVVEHVPMDLTVTPDDVQVIQIGPMDGDQTA